eukprot:1534097-Prymnesium_polylepis.1
MRCWCGATGWQERQLDRSKRYRSASAHSCGPTECWAGGAGRFHSRVSRDGHDTGRSDRGASNVRSAG